MKVGRRGLDPGALRRMPAGRYPSALLLAAALAAGSPAPARAQAAAPTLRDSLLAEGIRRAAMEPAEAAARFEALLALDSGDVEAGWRGAIALNDAALLLDAKADRARRDSLYARATTHARRALRLAPADARTLFALGLVLGNSALTRGGRERVRAGVEVRDLALRALAADSLHDGAHHLLGRWHMEVRRLSGIERLVARALLGGGVFGQASWEEARRHLERAVALDSTRIFHRLDLARLCYQRKDRDCAERELQRIRELPDRVAMDQAYRREAGALLLRVRSGS